MQTIAVERLSDGTPTPLSTETPLVERAHRALVAPAERFARRRRALPLLRAFGQEYGGGFAPVRAPLGLDGLLVRKLHPIEAGVDAPLHNEIVV
jgi:hypothetical protein